LFSANSGANRVPEATIDITPITDGAHGSMRLWAPEPAVNPLSLDILVSGVFLS
jgi:hypothetical protein